jgi:hypothetical protein
MGKTPTMGQDPSPSFRTRFTIRQLLILIAYLTLVFEFVIPLLAIAGGRSGWSAVTPILLISPPLLALLVMVFERPGPLKNWCVSFLNLLFFPALVLNHDVQSLRDYVHHGTTPALLPMLLLNGIVFAYVHAYRGRLVPNRCPGCQRRTLIPLLQLFKTEKRSSNTCWCASCGGKFWKDREGTWRPERRKTWIDVDAEPAPAQTPAPAIGRPKVLETTHRPVGGQATSEVRAS